MNGFSFPSKITSSKARTLRGSSAGGAAGGAGGGGGGAGAADAVVVVSDVGALLPSTARGAGRSPSWTCTMSSMREVAASSL